MFSASNSNSVAKDQILFLGDWYTTEPIQAADIIKNQSFVFNLEAPISCKGTPTSGKINLRMCENYIYSCFGKLPIAVNLANNHILDYGMEAFRETLVELDN